MSVVVQVVVVVELGGGIELWYGAYGMRTRCLHGGWGCTDMDRKMDVAHIETVDTAISMSSFFPFSVLFYGG